MAGITTEVLLGIMAGDRLSAERGASTQEVVGSTRMEETGRAPVQL